MLFASSYNNLQHYFAHKLYVSGHEIKGYLKHEVKIAFEGLTMCHFYTIFDLYEEEYNKPIQNMSALALFNEL